MKFKGYNYPIDKDAKGYWHSQEDVDQIKSDMLILLLTNPGERVMLPEFGTGLRELFFEPNDATLQANARQKIINAISLWEPRITVQQIEVLSQADDASLNNADDLTEAQSILMIRITFIDPDQIQEVQELVLEVPLGV